MFEKASRLKLRFNTIIGTISVEDLWDLPLSTGPMNLNDLAKSLNKRVKEVEEEDFVAKATKDNEALILKFELVKHVIKVKLEEAEIADNKAEAKEKKQKILAILADKEDESLKGKTKEELVELLNNL